MLFPGSNNAILLKREYYQEYSCEFDLRYYPFDTQMCEMIFQIQGKTDQYVKLVRDSIGKTNDLSEGIHSLLGRFNDLVFWREVNQNNVTRCGFFQSN